MKTVRPRVEIIDPPEYEKIIRLIELAGRVCYKSEGLIGKKSGEEFIRRIIGRGHHSVIEHCSFSVRFVIDRGISHQLVRHRLASVSQESTRYNDYSSRKFDGHVRIILPPWLPNIPEETWKIDPEAHTLFCDSNPKALEGLSPEEFDFLFSNCYAERAYFGAMKHYSWKPGEARCHLPTGTKTEVVFTANLREWRHVLTLRTSSKAHVQFREACALLMGEVTTRYPVFFEDLKAYREADENLMLTRAASAPMAEQSPETPILIEEVGNEN